MDQRRMRALAAIEATANAHATKKREASSSSSPSPPSHRNKIRKTKPPAALQNNKSASASSQSKNKTPSRKRPAETAEHTPSNFDKRTGQDDDEDRYRSFMERTLKQRLGGNSRSLMATLKGRVILLDNPHKGGDSEAIRLQREKREMANAARARGLTKAQKRVLYTSLRNEGVAPHVVRRLHCAWRQYIEEQLLLATGCASVDVLSEVLKMGDHHPEMLQMKTTQARSAERAISQCVATSALQGALVCRRAGSGDKNDGEHQQQEQRAVVVHESANGLFVIPIGSEFVLDQGGSNYNTTATGSSSSSSRTPISPAEATTVSASTKVKAKLWIKRSLHSVVILPCGSAATTGVAFEVQMSRLRENDRIGQLAVT
jgi:hypothetical protein